MNWKEKTWKLNPGTQKQVKITILSPQLNCCPNHRKQKGKQIGKHMFL